MEKKMDSEDLRGEITRLRKENEELERKLSDQKLCTHHANAVVDCAEREIAKLRAERPLIWQAAREGGIRGVMGGGNAPGVPSHYVREWSFPSFEDYDKLPTKVEILKY